MVGIIPDAGLGLIDSRFVNGIASGQNGTVQTLIAAAGGGQANAKQIGPAALMARIGTVVTTADSVKLPFAIRGAMVLVANAAANSANLYAKNGNNRATGIPDTINGVANGTAYAIATTVAVLFFCPADGVWFAIKTA